MTQHQDTAQYDQNGQLHAQTALPQEKQHAYEQAIEILAANLQGKVILPGDPAYEAEQKVWNGIVDLHPAAIIRCANAEDVRSAVNFAREQAMTLSMRSGGHSIAGRTNNGRLVIDLSDMKTMAINPVRRMARLQPRLTWGKVTNALQPFGLAITAGDVASVGAGGLLLGGGIGWMVCAYGLSIARL